MRRAARASRRNVGCSPIVGALPRAPWRHPPARCAYFVAWSDRQRMAGGHAARECPSYLAPVDRPHRRVVCAVCEGQSRRHDGTASRRGHDRGRAGRGRRRAHAPRRLLDGREAAIEFALRFPRRTNRVVVEGSAALARSADVRAPRYRRPKTRETPDQSSDMSGGPRNTMSRAGSTQKVSGKSISTGSRRAAASA